MERVMLIGAAFLLGLASVPVAGGRLRALETLDVRGRALLFAALAIQVVIISVLPGTGSPGLHTTAHLASYGLLAAFVCANRHAPFVWLIALGGALNLVAIAANGGVMPADPDALAGAGLADTVGEFANSSAVDQPALAWLGHVFAVPAAWPASNVFSVGDVVIVVAAIAAMHTLGGSRLALPGLASP